VDTAALVACEREVALDCDRLRDGGVAREAELGGDAPLVHLPAVRERRLLAVERERPVGGRRVLERPAHEAGRGDGHAVVGEGDRADIGQLAHLGQLLPPLRACDRGEEAGLDSRVATRGLHERAERRGRVHDRIGVRHGEDRAIAARSRGRRAARHGLLVFAAGRAQVDMRIDERRREDEPVRLDDAVLVRVHRLGDLGDRSVVDPHLEPRVGPLDRVEHARAAEHDVGARKLLLPEHHATSAAARACTPTGPPVRTS
jgi:hypothetical protein